MWAGVGGVVVDEKGVLWVARCDLSKFVYDWGCNTRQQPVDAVVLAKSSPYQNSRASASGAGVGRNSMARTEREGFDFQVKLLLIGDDSEEVPDACLYTHRTRHQHPVVRRRGKDKLTETLRR